MMIRPNKQLNSKKCFYVLDQSEFGLTLVEGMSQKGLLTELMSQIGVTKLTHYGAEFDVMAKQVSFFFSTHLVYPLKDFVKLQLSPFPGGYTPALQGYSG